MFYSDSNEESFVDSSALNVRCSYLMLCGAYLVYWTNVCFLLQQQNHCFSIDLFYVYIFLMLVRVCVCVCVCS